MTSKLLEPRWPGGIAPPQRIENCRCGNCTPTNRRTSVSVAEAVDMVDSVCELLAEKFTPTEQAEQSDPMVGREVAGVYLTPDGEVVKNIRTGAREPQRYAEPTSPWAENDARRGVPGDQSPPTSEAELALAKLRLKQLDAIIENPATDVTTRISAKIERSQVLEAIESITAALKTSPRIGPAPTAGAQQYAPMVPYWNEPRVSDSKKAELEAEAAWAPDAVAESGPHPVAGDQNRAGAHAHRAHTRQIGDRRRGGSAEPVGMVGGTRAPGGPSAAFSAS